MTKKKYLSLFILMSPTLLIIWTQMMNCNSFYFLNKILCPVSGFEISLNFDPISLSFFMTVCLISGLVLIYSEGYMSESGYNMFIITLFLFVLSMLIVTLSGNLLLLMVGWDGLGITSFLLILFFKNWTSFKSGLITLMLNRLGDVFMVLAMGHCILGGWILWPLLLILGAISKSAQLPYSTWLPLAMAAPTPVSSLVHSSTLVTAGVFVLVRYGVYLNDFLNFLKWVSCATLIYAGVNALFELDMKKIIAFSTLSHLSLMILTLSIKSVDLAILHMMTHAVFKSSLFMLAGWYIHMSLNLQSLIRSSSIPSSWAFYMWVVCAMSMAGLPGLSGFYSKELIILTHNGQLWIVFAFMLGVMLTMAYSVRLILSLVNSVSKFPIIIWEKMNIHMFIPILSGGLLSITIGSYLVWFFMLEGTGDPMVSAALLLKITVLISLMIGFLVGAVISMFNLKVSKWNLDWGLYNVIEHTKQVCDLVQKSVWEDMAFANVFLLSSHIQFQYILVNSKEHFLMKSSLLVAKTFITISVIFTIISM